jgi:cell division protein FtsX
VRPAVSDKFKIFFRTSATRAQEKADGARLRNEPCVRRVVFVSKAQALKVMKKQFPGLYQAGQPMAGTNPLPDAFTVTASKLSCVPTIARTVAHWPGVATVKWRV